MSTELVPTNVKLPAHLMSRINQPSAIAEAMSGGISSGEAVPKISIKASRFRIIEDGEEMLLDDIKLNTIIVGANPRISKVFYSGSWNPDVDPEAPDCFSLDGVRPDKSIATPQCDNCAECPNNAWGSKIVDDKELKACADKKRLAIVAADVPDGTVYLLEVTPAALKNLNKYQKELTMRGIPVDVVVTQVSFDTDASFPKLVFKFGGFLEEETLEIVEKLHGSEEVIRITGETHEAQTYLPAAKSKAKAEPEVEEEEVEEEEVSSTPAKTTFGKKKAEPKEEPKKAAFGKKAEPKAEPKEEPKKASFGKKAEPKAEPKAETKKAEPKKSPSVKEKAAAAAGDDAQSLADEIEGLLGDAFDD